MLCAMYWNQMRWPQARALDEIAAHQPDLGAEAACKELRVERPVQGVVLVRRDQEAGRVRLVLQRHPADVRQAPLFDEVLENRGEPAHEERRLQPRRGRRLVRDVDRRPGVLGELNRLDERGHVGCVGFLPDVVEDAYEVRLERLHLRFEIGERCRRRRRDRGEDVLVELRPVAAEAVDEQA